MYYANPNIRSHSQVRQTDYSILVTGDGTVSVEPNQAVVTLGVITEDSNLQKAQRENAESTNNIIQALLQENIPRHHIQTYDYRMDIQYDYDEGIQIFRGYRVTNLLEVIIEPIDKVGLIIDTAVDYGANTVRNIQLTVANQDRYYLEALQKAVENTQIKASIIAQELGVSISSIPYSLKEISRREESESRPVVLGVSTDSPITPIEPGRLAIKAKVEAEFRY
ncbi:SIMPL domain-containing protein [Gracilibacillus saliphilus]|uniref:SIMPL domain-containing protein n=1 Tax=Gracilibacillus saliphilus TaxID=543890 RepID=UPI001EE348E3|nr:SIMPL domain-containing protein [Gracilibacillus saliphilus]